MTMKRIWLSGLLALLTLTTAQADPGAMHETGKRLHEMVQRLHLDGAQREAAHELFELLRERATPLMARAQMVRGELRALLESQSNDYEAIGRLASEGHQLKRDLRQLRSETMAAFADLLDVQQRAKFDLMREVHAERRRARRWGD